MELTKKYRPTNLEAVFNQDQAVQVLDSMLNENSLPHMLLFTGPSGCGKTTLARIVKDRLGCGEFDFEEINSADFRGIDMVRDIRNRMHLASISGSCRVWLIDEAHMLTAPAQEAALKMLEDTPKHGYFIICTTNPEKLKKTFRTRGTEIKVNPFDKKAAFKLLSFVIEKEGLEIPESVKKAIAEACDLSARSALTILEQVSHLDDEDEMLKVISNAAVKTKAIDLARKLLKPTTQFKAVLPILKVLDDEPESVRRVILAYVTSIMQNGKMVDRCYVLLDSFRDNYYDSGKAGLMASCYEATQK